MAKNDVKIIRGGGTIQEYRVDDRTTSSDTQIFAGDPVQIGQAGANFVEHLATAEPTATEEMTGIAVTDSTETTSAEGTVQVQVVIPGVSVMECKATTPANMDTDAELKAILNDQVAFDLTGTTYTIDENQGDSTSNGLRILNGDIEKGTLTFMLVNHASDYGAAS